MTVSGTIGIILQVTLSVFTLVYCKRMIKTGNADEIQLSIWESNFQLAFGSLFI